jgi:hypothetical protein
MKYEGGHFFSAMQDIYVSCDGYRPEMKAGKNGLFDMPAEYCEKTWDNFEEGDFTNDVHYDIANEKIICNSCGGEVDIWVSESH